MRAMQTAIAAALVLTACAGGDSVGNDGVVSPFGSPGGPGSVGDDDDGGDDEDSSDDGAAPAPEPTGDCCTPGGQGCANDPAVEACVCDLDDYCCTNQWDAGCVLMVGQCGEACQGAMPDSESSGGVDSDPVAESTGVVDDGGVEESGLGEESGVFDDTGFGEEGGVGGDGDCCAPTGVPGCNDPFVASCVCFIDDYCCFVEWDGQCADIAFDCGC